MSLWIHYAVALALGRIVALWIVRAVAQRNSRHYTYVRLCLRPP